MKFFSDKRNREIASHLPIALNAALIALGIFILLSMSVVLAIFEEFTAFTDYTQDWIEFNFFIHYWDKLAITRVYLSFLFIYGAAILTIASTQIHAYRKKNINLMHFTPFLLFFVAIISVLGAVCWLIVTAVNHNEGFLATGGFIFERMRFKGNVWKDLKYREQSFRVVTAKEVPRKAPILYTWVHQRERDFECCGWDSFLDYNRGGWAELPESCCNRKHRTFRCGADYLNNTAILNTRGCGAVMHSWYRTGFTVNIIMAVIGILIAAYQFFLYTYNRKQYYSYLRDLDEYRSPFIKKKPINSSRGANPIYTQVKTDQNTPNRTRPPVSMKNFNRINENDESEIPDVSTNVNRPFVNPIIGSRIYKPMNGSSHEIEPLNYE